MEDNFDQNINQQPAAPVRRRKRKRRPKWQRLLWKYWPPIRLGLIILAAILVLWLVISVIGAAFGGGDPDPSDTTPPPETSSSSSESTADTTPNETTVDTTPPETTEPPVTDPYAGAVSDDWYDNTLFIGDSRTVGLRDYGRSGNADYFCTVGMSVFNFEKQTASDTNFEKQTLESLLSSKTYDKIFLSLGINECGYPTSSLMKAYTEMVDFIRQLQPDAKIILQGIMVVSESYANGASYFEPSHIAGINEKIEALADGVSIFYIDINDSFANSDGYLLPAVTSDGCHLYASNYADWAKLISADVGKLGIE